jgi:hypothetical protein
LQIRFYFRKDVIQDTLFVPVVRFVLIIFIAGNGTGKDVEKIIYFLLCKIFKHLVPKTITGTCKTTLVIILLKGTVSRKIWRDEGMGL